jgi:hypothetical protein
MAARAGPLLRAGQHELAVELPGDPDAAARRDGLPAPGRRSEGLRALLAATPLSTWSVELVQLPIADDLGEVVRSGWAGAAAAQRNEQWARALWPLHPDTRLLAVLPRAEAEALAAASDDPIAAAAALPGQWGAELSRAVIAAIGRRRQAGEWLEASWAGHLLDPSVEPEAEALRELGGRDLWRLADVLGERAAMLRELG